MMFVFHKTFKKNNEWDTVALMFPRLPTLPQPTQKHTSFWGRWYNFLEFWCYVS